jgi:O-antigen/teichoic acid export membrane protein
LVVVLPLVLSKLPIEEITLWYLFSLILGLQILLDAGFTPTFSRLIAYEMAESLNGEAIEKVCTTMRSIYFRLTILSVAFLSTIGTYTLINPIAKTNNEIHSYTAWFIILLVSAIYMYGGIYNAYLQGINQIALLRRYEILTSLGAIISSCLVLVFNKSLLGLVIANQAWILISVLINRWLCFNIKASHFSQSKNAIIEPEVFRVAWPSAWRSFIGILMGYGLAQFSSIIYAQISAVSEAASYLVATRLIQVISQFSQAPFYSKLPTLSRLWSEGERSKQISLAARGMTLANWMYTTGFIATGLLAEPLFNLVGSNASFVNPRLWSLMGLAVFSERYGAMHIQLYSTTNHIIWHIANGISGIIYVLVCVLLFNHIGVYAFPLSTLASYLGFYCWYSASHSYRTFNLELIPFELKTTVIPLSILLVYSVISFVALDR